MNKIFDDDLSKQLYKQIQKAQEYLHSQLDKSLTKQLILSILDRNLLPILFYPDREPMMMPMTYSLKRDSQINIHTPIPELRLYELGDYTCKLNGTPEEFFELIEDMKKRVEKLYD